MTLSVEHHSALPASHRLHEYRIERVLGFGGFGITYLATDTNLNKLVAIKEYLPAALAIRAADTSVMPSAGEYAADFRWGLERFVEEARTLARFRHANLVPVHRYFEANGTAYVVMEYERGERLDEFLKRKPGALSQAEIMALLAGLLDGLEAVHRAGYLHRDIKPANIILREDGSPVLVDFGAARQALGQRSHNVTAIVTPGYAPLEQYAGDGKQGPWTDLYAVGALAHRLIAGTPPPEATSRARNDPYRPLAQRKPSAYDAELLSAVDWALQVDEHQRPQSVRDFRRALAHAGNPSSAVAAHAVPAARRIALPLLFASLALLLVLGGGFYLYQRQAEQERQQALDVQRQQETARQAQEQARVAEQRAAAERAAAEKVAADKAAAGKPPATQQAVTAAMTSQRGAELAREAAAKAREFAAQARRGAELGRQKANQARDQAAAARQAAAAANAGRIEIATGVVYRGGVKADKRDGLGVLTAPTGFRYEGQWRDNTVTGLGVSYEGEARDRYEGEYVAGKRQGHGTYHFADGLRYEGAFEQNGRTGPGVSYAGNGASIEAKWIDGTPDNFAVVHDGKGLRYEGSMVDRRFSGFGILFMPDGQRYEGAYREDMHNGYGILYLPNGTRRSGLWQDGRLVKPD